MDIIDSTLDSLRGIIIFNIGSKEYCTDIKNVVTIMKPAELKIFKAKNSEDPEAHYNDNQFKLIDIQFLYEYPAIKVDDNTRIILFEAFGKHFGFYVNKVIEIITIDKIFLEKGLDIIPINNIPYVSEILKLQEREILIPHFERFSKDLARLKGSSLVKDLKRNSFFQLL